MRLNRYQAEFLRSELGVSTQRNMQLEVPTCFPLVDPPTRPR